MYKVLLNRVRFEALTTVMMRNSFLWDMMLCGSLKATSVSEERIATIFMVEACSSKICIHFNGLQNQNPCKSEIGSVSVFR
jgi:hypothetical protein